MNRLVLLTIPLLTASAHAQLNEESEGVLDLCDLPNYANQPVPNYINRDNTPPGNEITELGAALGRVLFYDKRLSRNNTVSCASCHQQEHGFSDLAPASSGVAGTTGRHSMRLINARFAQEPTAFWDERANSFERQATQPIQDHVEMGFSGTLDDPDFGELVIRLEAIPEYEVLFNGVFGSPTISEGRIQQAIAQFVRSIQSFDSKYDQGRAQVNNDGTPFPNFTAAENRGKNLFLSPPGRGGGAGCAACHRPPEFDIVPNSGNNGVVGSLLGGDDFTVTRSPSLRDLVGPGGSSNGPFMHDASKADLAAVVAHYNNIPAVVPGLDPRLTRRGGPGEPPQPQTLGLDAGERADLVAFLTTLTGNNVYTDPKWSDPFAADGSLSLIVMPPNCLKITVAGGNISCEAIGVPHTEYILQVSDSSTFASVSSTNLTADENGLMQMTTPMDSSPSKRFYRLIYRP